MRREWRFGGRSDAWRTRRATADTSGLPADLTGAFIDRLPIGWTALRARVCTTADRTLFETLRLLDLVRGPSSPGPSSPETRARPAVIVRLVLALAALQTACCLAAVVVVALSGHAAAGRASPLVLAVAFSGAGMLLGATAARDRRSLFLLAAFACVASAFARAAVTGLPEAWSIHLDVILRGLFPAAFAPALFWHFVLEFPRVQRFTSFDLLARRATAGAWLLGALLFGVNLAAAHHLMDAGPAMLLTRDNPTNTFWDLFVLATLPALAAILVRSRRAPRAERRKVARFAFAIAAGTAPFLLCGLARMILPPVDEWFLLAASGQRLWLDGLVIGSLTATPVLSTIALMVDRPFERQTRSVVPSGERLARAGLTAVVAAPFVTLVVTLYQVRHVAIVNLPSTSRAWVLLVSAVAGALIVFAGSRRVTALSARRARHAPELDREWLSAALERVRLARGARAIGFVLARELSRGIGATTTHVLFPLSSGVLVDPLRVATPLGPDTALTAILGQVPTPLDLSDRSPDRSLRPLLPPADREWAIANGVELAGALRQRDGTIAAIVAFGRKPGERAFDRRDRWLVTTLIGAADGIPNGGADMAPARNDESGDSQAAFECLRCGRVGGSIPVGCRCASGAALASLPHHLAGKFVVERRIDAGGMGVVYLGRDVALGRFVALKTLPALRDGTVGRLRDEARAMATLNHDALATLYGLELWQGVPVLVEEYFPGGTLATRLIAGRLSPAAAMTLGVRLARGLGYMHACGVLHRDLKPSNIAFTATGDSKLLDFGLSTLLGPATAVAGTGGRGVRPIAGTPAYLSPESRRGVAPQPASDLWALSVVILEAMIGRNAFATGDRARALSRALKVDLPGLSACPPGTVTLLHAFFERALARRPERRFQTSVELQAALETLARAFGS